MVPKDEQYKIKAYFEIGLPVVSIANRLDLHPATVSKILKGGFNEMKKGSKLGEFKDYINKRLESYPELTAVSIFKEIKESGYYLPLDTEGAKLFFELVSQRYEKGSIVVTSNRSFSEWDKIFSDSVLATAVLDRLLHHSSVINIRGKSYRLKDKQKNGLIGAKVLES